MLGKLLKHEFAATGRVFLPFFVVLLALGLGSNFSLRTLENSNVAALRVTSGIVLILFAIALFVTGVLAVVQTVRRFYQNLLTDEGYLMFSLPVSVHGLVLSKVIVSAVWFLVTGLVMLLAGWLAVFRISQVTDSLADIQNLLARLNASYALNGAAIIAELLLVIFLACALLSLMFYAAMSLGHTFTEHRVLLSVVFFILFSIALQIVLAVCLSVGGEPFELGEIGQVALIHILLLGVSVTEVIASGVFYAITALSLQRRLNLA